MLRDDFINIGEITSVFGIKGWVKVHSFTEPRENILNYSPWFLKKENEVQEIKLLNGKRQGKTIVVSLDGVFDRDVAAGYSGWDIQIKQSQLPKPESGEYYWADLIGLQVETDEGILLGKVDYLIETGANDVLVVQDGETERLIPFLQDQVIKKIDLESRQMVVDWDPDF